MKSLSMMIFPACGGVCAAGWYGFHSLQPKDLKEYLEWQGFQLASSDNSWKAVIKEHGELAKSIEVQSESDLEKLKSWCANHLPLSDFSSHIDKATKLCVDNVGTVEAKLVRDGISVDIFFQESSSAEKYKTAYVFRKHNSDFLSLIGHTPEEEEGFEPAVIKYKEWCNSTLKAKPETSLFENFKLFCKPKSFSTVKDYLDTFGLKYLTGDTQGLKGMWERIKGFASYKQDIQEIGENALKTWCEENLKKNFHDEMKVFDDILKKVKARCTKGSEVVDS
ncbi:hypothetical protein HF1_09880 [Mycoplasma haemofelis str. Langford 1]|uniref:Uncharacterized protein n=1 Tax=Mycoplasma haemofelis (strain Langford 1) TaxID=941640 RepID=E8ZIM5_MYCHL|nr:hypothetical protein [Mycoplasma haemofelis]CBY92996.1 hypothetical protein HF1_09880 [Mycoplasma haemofelis str. Langford 1]